MRPAFIAFALACLLPIPAFAQVNTNYPYATLNLTADSLVYDSVTQMLYASIPNSVGGLTGNTITAINPFTRTIGASYSVGSNLGQLYVGASGGVVYASIGNGTAVVPFNTLTHAAGTPISFGGTNVAESVAVSPTNSNLAAISTITPGISPGFVALTVYNNGVKGPTGPTPITDSITFGADGQHLYGYCNEISTFDYSRFSVGGANQTTITQLSDDTNAVTGFPAHLKYNTGRIFGTNGVVINADTEQFLGYIDPGIYGNNYPLLADGANGRAYAITGSQGLVLRFYSINNSTTSYVEQTTATYTFPDYYESAGNLTTFGANGLALTTTDGTIDFFNPSAVPEPGSLWLCGSSLAAIVASAYARRRR